MSILITICARGGSKGIPDKNIKLLNGKPLLHYTLELALKFSDKHDADIQLSTDSQKIKEAAAGLGYVTDYVRPDHLAGDKVGKIDVIRQAWIFAEEANSKKYDYVLDLDITSPLRNLNDLEEAYSTIKSNPDALNLFSVSPASRNPYFNMVEKGANGFFNVVKPMGQVLSRQEAPLVYDMNASFYYFTREFLEGNYTISTTERSLIYLVSHVCFDLDEPFDFKVMEILIQEDLLDFEL